MVIGSILRTKGSSVVSVGAQDDVGTIARALAQHRIGAVLVRDAGGDVLGIVSERDIARCVAAHGAEAVTLPAARLMTAACGAFGPRRTR